MKSLNELATITKYVMIDIKDIYVPYGELMSLVNKKFIPYYTVMCTRRQRWNGRTMLVL